MRKLAFLILVLSILFNVAIVEAGPIYVFKEKDGTIRFTDKKPPSGVNAQVFTGKGTTYTTYRSPYRKRTVSKKLYVNEYRDLIIDAAHEHNLDPHLIRAVIHAESAFDPWALSPKGARGLMQIMPATARDLGIRNAFDPEQNISGGAQYLSSLLARYKGNMKLALAAYNAGFMNVERYKGIPPYDETVQYVHRVLALRSRYQSNAAG